MSSSSNFIPQKMGTFTSSSSDLYDSKETSEIDEDSNHIDGCMSCGKETDSMEYCCNAGCDIYLCSTCYIKTSSGEIICNGCVGNCFCCNDIINLSDIEESTDITCSFCNIEGIYCEKCIETFHLYSCNLGLCHSCTEKCISCKSVQCCNKTFHTTGMCEMCVYFQFRESKEYMTRNLLTEYFYKDLCDIIYNYIDN